MATIKIDTRRTYEIFIKSRVAKLQVSNKHKAVIRKLIMEGFDDGAAMRGEGLEVEVSDD